MPYVSTPSAPYSFAPPVVISGLNTAFTTGVFPANPLRKSLNVQNVGSGGPLFIALNAGPASMTNFHRALAAAPSHFGAGGTFVDVSWTGALAYSGQAFVWANIWETQ